MSKRLKCSRRLEAGGGRGRSSLFVLETDQRTPCPGLCWKGRVSGRFRGNSDAISLAMKQSLLSNLLARSLLALTHGRLLATPGNHMLEIT